MIPSNSTTEYQIVHTSLDANIVLKFKRSSVHSNKLAKMKFTVTND